MNQIQQLCEHAEGARFFAPDSKGNQSMMCGDCGIVFTLIHACMFHAVIAIEGSDEIIYNAVGDPDIECQEDPSGAMDLERLMSTDAA